MDTYCCLQIFPKMLCLSTKPVISHTLPVPEDSTQPTPFCLAQRTQHVHTATCKGRRHINTPGSTSLVENCWKKLCLYHFSPRVLNTLGKVWLIPAGGAMRLDPISLWEMPLHPLQNPKEKEGKSVLCVKPHYKNVNSKIFSKNFFFEYYM